MDIENITNPRKKHQIASTSPAWAFLVCTLAPYIAEPSSPKQIDVRYIFDRRRIQAKAPLVARWRDFRQLTCQETYSIVKHINLDS